MLALSVIMAVSSCSLPFKKDPMLELEYTEFPTEKYDADKVHPIRTSGTLSGAEAEAELSAVEWDYLKHYFEDDYIALRWCLSDPAAAGFVYNGGIYRDYMAQARADICVNYEGLTLNETAEYISGLAPDISVVRSDIITMPGVGISYGLGCYMTLKTLESVRALDPEMDVKTMHTLYLDAGPGCFDRILTSVKRELE